MPCRLGQCECYQQKNLAWALKARETVGSRCKFVICTDASAHVGEPSGGVNSSAYVGAQNPARENSNGKLLREFLADSDMVATNTFFDVGPTYFGEQSNSRVVYILYPRPSFRTDISACTVWHKSGERLRHVKTFAR